MSHGNLMEVGCVPAQQVSIGQNRHLERTPTIELDDKNDRNIVRNNNSVSKSRHRHAHRYRSPVYWRHQGTIAQSDACIGRLVGFEASLSLASGVGAPILCSVLNVINKSEAVQVRDQSMSKPQPRWRRIAPHALGFEGFRGNARAGCLKDSVFKVSAFSDASKNHARKASDFDPQSGLDWQRKVGLVVVTHPSFSNAQQAAVDPEYAKKTGRVTLLVRSAMLNDALRTRRLGADLAMSIPKHQQIAPVRQEITL